MQKYLVFKVCLTYFFILRTLLQGRNLLCGRFILENDSWWMQLSPNQVSTGLQTTHLALLPSASDLQTDVRSFQQLDKEEIWRTYTWGTCDYSSNSQAGTPIAGNWRQSEKPQELAGPSMNTGGCAARAWIRRPGKHTLNLVTRQGRTGGKFF